MRVSTLFGCIASCLPGLALGQNRITLLPATGVASIEFTDAISFREFSDGSVIIGDRREKRVIHLEFEAEAIHEIGRPGEGPAEFKGVGWMYVLGADSTLFTDSYNLSWHFIVSDEIVETLGRTRPLVGFLGAQLSGTDMAGHALGVAPLPNQEGRTTRGNADSLVLVLADRSDSTLDTLTVLRGPGPMNTKMIPNFRGGMDAIFEGNPFDTEDMAVLFQDGWIAVVRVSPYRVDWRSPDGMWATGPLLPYDPVPVTKEEMCTAVGWWLNSDWECDPSLAEPWPDVIPPFITHRRLDDIYSAPGGAVVIRRAPSSIIPNPRYDIVGRDGRLQGILELGARERILGFGRASIYILETDPLTDLQSLRRHPWAGSESP
jgi:hypothetical protein